VPQSVRYPKPLIEKIGIKPGMRVLIVGRKQPAGEEGFWPAVHDRAKPSILGAGNDLVLFFADAIDQLIQLDVLRSRILPSGAVWVVYPKGLKTIREVDVIAAGKKHGFVDNKIASFSDTHTAMRLVIPVSARSPIPNP
jgi:hypothetical protein